MRCKEKELQRSYASTNIRHCQSVFLFPPQTSCLAVPSSGMPTLEFSHSFHLSLGKKSRSDMSGLLATELTGTALKRPPAAKPFTALQHFVNTINAGDSGDIFQKCFCQRLNQGESVQAYFVIPGSAAGLCYIHTNTNVLSTNGETCANP